MITDQDLGCPGDADLAFVTADEFDDFDDVDSTTVEDDGAPEADVEPDAEPAGDGAASPESPVTAGRR